MIILHDKPGQMCNRMWSHVHFIANALRTGNKTVIPFFGDYAHFFENLDRSEPVKFIKLHHAIYEKTLLYCFLALRCLPTFLLRLVHVYVDRKRWYAENWPDKILNGRRNVVFLSGWNHPKPALNLLDFHPVLREIYRPKASHVDKVESFLKSRAGRYDLIVGVHLRRGDYKDFAGGAYYYDDSIYAAYLRQLVGDPRFKDKNVGFLLCSNQTVDLPAYHGLEIFQLPGANSIEDLYVLSRCDYLLAPPSSFSMWASFYGQVPLRILKYPSEALDASQFSPIVAIDRFANGQVFEHVQVS